MQIKIKNFKVKKRYPLYNLWWQSFVNLITFKRNETYYYYDVVITAVRDGDILYRYKEFIVQLPDNTRLVVMNVNYSTSDYGVYEIHAMSYEPSSKNLTKYKPDTATILLY